jgi:hypothetical protein
VKNEDRIKAIQDLVKLRIQLPDAISRLKQFPWDSEAELVALTRTDTRRLLHEYLEGALSADSVEEWANAVEGRDDIGFEKGFEALLKDFVFELANPDLAQRMTPSHARDWIRRLA